MVAVPDRSITIIRIGVKLQQSLLCDHGEYLMNFKKCSVINIMVISTYFFSYFFCTTSTYYACSIFKFLGLLHFLHICQLYMCVISFNNLIVSFFCCCFYFIYMFFVFYFLSKFGYKIVIPLIISGPLLTLVSRFIYLWLLFSLLLIFHSCFSVFFSMYCPSLCYLKFVLLLIHEWSKNRAFCQHYCCWFVLCLQITWPNLI